MPVDYLDTPPQIRSLRALRRHLRSEVPDYPAFHEITGADCEQLAVMLQLDLQYRFQVWATLVPLFVAVIKHRTLIEIIEQLSAAVAPANKARSLFLLAYAEAYERDRREQINTRAYLRPEVKHLQNQVYEGATAIRTLKELTNENNYSDRDPLFAELNKLEEWIDYRKHAIRYMANGMQRDWSPSAYKRRGCHPQARVALAHLVQIFRSNSTNRHWFRLFERTMRRIDIKVTPSSLKRWERDAAVK
jgi:hypothetical protein